MCFFHQRPEKCSYKQPGALIVLTRCRLLLHGNLLERCFFGPGRVTFFFLFSSFFLPNWSVWCFFLKFSLVNGAGNTAGNVYHFFHMVATLLFKLKKSWTSKLHQRLSWYLGHLLPSDV